MLTQYCSSVCEIQHVDDEEYRHVDEDNLANFFSNHNVPSVIYPPSEHASVSR